MDLPCWNLCSYLLLLYLLVASSRALFHSDQLKHGFHSLFVRMPQLKLEVTPASFIMNFSDIEQCAARCVRQTEFDCRSFDVDNRARTCRLYNMTHTEGEAYLRESAGTDHYRTAFEKKFNKLPNHILTFQHKRKVPSISVEECARRCLFEQSFRCAGFDYEPGYANCWLTDRTVAEGGVKFHTGADFYERDFGGALSNFISFGHGSLPFVDDRTVYESTIFHLDLGACAQVCLSQTSFECTSFDYVFAERSCHMSRYTAATVGGLQNETMPTHRIMHYEKKGPYLERFYATPYSIVLQENHKKLERVEPDRCAQACLEETAFVCRSFDYQIKDRSCMLSQKTSSDVGKLYNQGREQVHHFELKPSLDCGGTYSSQVGDFASPGWPRNYTHHLNCTWTVQVPAHKVIMFTFLHFDLGKKSSTSCSEENDRLRITEMTSHGEFRFCASPPMMNYISQTNAVSLNFVTNSHSDAQGFKVIYKGDWPCRATLTNDRGEIASPAWPEQYSPGLNCAWTIQAPAHAQVTLKFTTIDLDGQSFGSCSSQRDVINVFDGATAMDTRLARYCQHENPSPLISSRNLMLVTFRSDAHVQRTGFHASFDFIIPSPSPAVASGPGSYGDKTSSGTGNDDYENGQYDKDKDALYDKNDGGAGLLTAVVVEPRWETGQNHFRGNYTEDVNFGFNGGEFVQSKYPHGGSTSTGGNGRKRGVTTNTYISILWTLLVSLLVITLFLLVLLFMVCRNNRSNQDKRKAVDKYTYNKEESLSLYEKEIAEPKVINEDIDYFRFAVSFPPDRTPAECETLCYPRQASQDLDNDSAVAFSNPLYQSRRTLMPMRSNLTLASEVLSDSGCSSSNNYSNSACSNGACQGSTMLLTSPC